jgi:acetolactate synthase-1/2/3 large subunit
MTQMTGSRYFAEAMKAYDVSHLFFVPVILLKAMGEMKGMGITRVSAHSEKSAVYMADGYARASGNPGICMSQTIGAANLAAGLRDAYLARSPVIAITGGQLPESRHRLAYQEIEDFQLFEPVTKFNARVDQAERLPDLLRQAFRSVTTGCPAPAHLELGGIIGQVIDVEADLDTTFETRFSSLPAFRPLAEPEEVARVAGMLARASRPVIIAGGGVKSSGAEDELVALARMLNVPVATSLNAKGSILENDPLSIGLVGTYSRECTNRIVCEADLVFYIGSLTGGQVTNNWTVPQPGTPVIQLDIDPAGLGRNYPNVASLCGDARATLRQLIEAAEGLPVNSVRKAWHARTAELISEWRASVESQVHSDATPIRPERMAKEISDFLPSDAIVLAGTGHSGLWAGMHMELTSPDQTFLRAAGSLGWSFPAALGAKCAAPERPVICFTGDGGFYYHMSDLETAVRYGINAVIVVNNNRSLSMEREIYTDECGMDTAEARALWVYEDNNLAKVAESLGCLGIRVEKASELQPALEQAVAANRPVVVDVVGDMDTMAPLGWSPSA